MTKIIHIDSEDSDKIAALEASGIRVDISPGPDGVTVIFPDELSSEVERIINQE